MPVQLDEVTRAFLNEPHAAVLATVSRKGRLQATPIWFVMDGDHTYLALTVVDPKNMYRYVQIQGRVVRFDAKNGARDIDRLSKRYTGQPYSYQYGGKPEDRVTIVIEPLAVSGMGRG